MGSELKRFASSVKSVNEMRFEPIESRGKAIVTRDEMDQLVVVTNDRLQKIQNAFNELLLAARFVNQTTTTVTETDTVTAASAARSEHVAPGARGEKGDTGAAGADGDTGVLAWLGL